MYIKIEKKRKEKKKKKTYVLTYPAVVVYRKSHVQASLVQVGARGPAALVKSRAKQKQTYRLIPTRSLTLAARPSRAPFGGVIRSERLDPMIPEAHDP